MSALLTVLIEIWAIPMLVFITYCHALIIAKWKVYWQYWVLQYTILHISNRLIWYVHILSYFVKLHFRLLRTCVLSKNIVNFFRQLMTNFFCFFILQQVVFNYVFLVLLFVAYDGRELFRECLCNTCRHSRHEVETTGSRSVHIVAGWSARTLWIYWIQCCKVCLAWTCRSAADGGVTIFS